MAKTKSSARVAPNAKAGRRKVYGVGSVRKTKAFGQGDGYQMPDRTAKDWAQFEGRMINPQWWPSRPNQPAFVQRPA